METLVEVALALAIIWGFITIQMYVPTGSMLPTIMPGDRFFVDKISYYFRDPEPGDVVVFRHLDELQVTGVREGSPAGLAGVQPGDWLVFSGPASIATLVGVAGEPVPSMITLHRRIEAAQGGTLPLDLLRGMRLLRVEVEVPTGAKDLSDLGIAARANRSRYVKRLIAVGGQTVWIGEGGMVYVDGEPLAAVADHAYSTREPGIRYGIEPTTVPEGHYFVLGDNTTDSYDSRYWGFVPVEEFIGEPYFRVWPFSRFGPMNGYFGAAR